MKFTPVDAQPEAPEVQAVRPPEVTVVPPVAPVPAEVKPALQPIPPVESAPASVPRTEDAKPVIPKKSAATPVAPASAPVKAPKVAKPAVAAKLDPGKIEETPASVKGQPTRVMNFGPSAPAASKPEAGKAAEPGQPTRVMNFGLKSTDAKPEAGKAEETPASVKGQATRTFNFGASAPVEAKPVAAPAKAVPIPQPRVAAAERPIVVILRRLLRNPKFLIGMAGLVAALVILPWGTRVLMKPKPEAAVKADFNTQEIATFDKLIDQILPEKLDWGREVMHRRLLTRFPEELQMEVDKNNRDIKWDGKGKVLAYYRFSIAYHFKEEARENYSWKPVTFFFRMEAGKWVMMGERWMREDEVLFE
jgi:hypothetical protein